MGTRASAWSNQYLGGAQRRSIGRLAGLLALALLVVPASASAEGDVAPLPNPVAWRPPDWLNTQPPFARPTPVTGAACPSPEFCIALDGSGDVLTSTEPTGGAGAWSIDSVDAEGGFTDLSCPAVELCFAVDDAGNVFDWNEPPARQFAPSDGRRVDGSTRLESLSCPSWRLCVAGDAHGNLLVSTGPSAIAPRWQTIDPDLGHSSPIRGVSCPTVNACVAVSEEGQIFASLTPSFDEAWTASTPPGSHSLFDVSCASESSCVVSADSGDVLTSADPFENSPTWSAAHVGTGSLGRLDCTAGLCVAAAPGGILTSTEPAGGAGDWEATPLDLPDGSGGQAALTSVSCSGVELCLLGDSASSVLTSTEPGGGEGAWAPVALSVGSSTPQGVACKYDFHCIAVDDAGNLFTLSSPAWLLSPWTQQHVDAHPLTAVACGSICIAVDDAGGVLTASGSYWDSASIWSRLDVDSGIPLTGASCADNSPFCAVIDQDGNVLVSEDPDREDFKWTATHLSANGLDGISCPSSKLCVATDEGSVLVSTEPAGGAGAWTKTYVNAGRSISCPTTELCVTVREDGGILVSTEPLGGAAAWTETQATGINGLDEIGCGEEWTGALCVVTGYGGNGSSGNLLESLNPAGEGWSHGNVYHAVITPPDPTMDLHTKDLTGVSCAGGRMCAIVDAHGTAIVSEIPHGHPPVPHEPPEVPPPAPEASPSAEVRGNESASTQQAQPAVGGALQITGAHVTHEGEIDLSIHAPAAGSLKVRAAVTGSPRSRLTYRGASVAAQGPGTVRVALTPRRPFSARRRSRVRIVVAYLSPYGGRLTERKSLPIG